MPRKPGEPRKRQPLDRLKPGEKLPGTRFEVERRFSGGVPGEPDIAKAHAWKLLEQHGIRLPAKGLEKNPDWLRLRHIIGTLQRPGVPREERRALEGDLERHLADMKKRLKG
jgi:hypothetical protein